MRILHVANPHVGAICLEHLLEELPQGTEIVGVVTPMGQRMRKLPLRRSLKRSWRKLRRSSASSLVEKALSRFYTNSPTFETRDIVEVAEAAGLPVHGSSLLVNPSAFAALRIDLVIVTTFVERIPKPVLEGTTHGGLNYHPSMLPLYRGGSPEYSAIRDGQSEAGVTIHYMDAKFDTGDIVRQQVIPLRSDETAWSYGNRAAHVGKVLLADVIASIANGSVERTPQDVSLATLSYKNYEIHRKVQWHQTADQVERQVRACRHHMTRGAYFYRGRRRIYPATAQALPQGVVPRGSPGATVGKTPTTLLLQCGEGLLEVSTVWVGAEERGVHEPV